MLKMCIAPKALSLTAFHFSFDTASALLVPVMENPWRAAREKEEQEKSDEWRAKMDSHLCDLRKHAAKQSYQWAIEHIDRCLLSKLSSNSILFSNTLRTLFTANICSQCYTEDVYDIEFVQWTMTTNLGTTSIDLGHDSWLHFAHLCNSVT